MTIMVRKGVKAYGYCGLVALTLLGAVLYGVLVHLAGGTEEPKLEASEESGRDDRHRAA